MTGRTVSEWIASHPDQPIPARVKARIHLRCQGRCAITGVKLGPGVPFDFDHIKPLSMGGEHRESNLQTVLREAHRQKTAEEAPARAKADRIRAKHLGLFPKSKRPLKSKGFEKSR